MVPRGNLSEKTEHSSVVSNGRQRGESGTRRSVGLHLIDWIKQILPCDWLRTQYAQQTRHFGRKPFTNCLNTSYIISLPGKQVLKADTSLNSPLPQALMAATRNL